MKRKSDVFFLVIKFSSFCPTFEEEFNAPLDLDSDPVWTWSDGGLYEGAVRFVKQQISFSGGKMKITAKPNPGHWALNEVNNILLFVFQSQNLCFWKSC